MSNVSTLTYRESLYFQKKTRISLEEISLRFCNRRFVFRIEIHCTSGGRRKECDQGWCHLPDSLVVEIFAGHFAHEDHDHLSRHLPWTHQQEGICKHTFSGE